MFFKRFKRKDQPCREASATGHPRVAGAERIKPPKNKNPNHVNLLKSGCEEKL